MFMSGRQCSTQICAFVLHLKEVFFISAGSERAEWSRAAACVGFNMILSAAIWPGSGSITELHSVNNLCVQEAPKSAAQLINPLLMVTRKENAMNQHKRVFASMHVRAKRNVLSRMRCI